MDTYFPIDDALSERDSVYIGKVFLQEKETIFFTVSRSGYCGVDNCTWFVYAYQANLSEVKPVIKNIFSHVKNIIVSSDKTKIAVEAIASGGICDVGSYLYLYDQKAGKTGKISDLDLEDYRIIKIENLKFPEPDTLEIELVHSNCPSTNTKGEAFRRKVICEIVEVNQPKCS